MLRHLYLFSISMFEVNAWLTSSWNDLHVDFDVHLVLCHFFLLPVRWNDEYAVWTVWWAALLVRLVCIPHGNATNANNIHDVHSTSGSYWRICQYRMHSFHIQKGKSSVFDARNVHCNFNSFQYQFSFLFRRLTVRFRILWHFIKFKFNCST